LIASMSMDSASCNGVADGTATANGITGGNGINSFSWNTTPVQTTNPATGLAAGNYTITVTDQKGCFTTRDTYGIRARCIIDCFYEYGQC